MWAIVLLTAMIVAILLLGWVAVNLSNRVHLLENKNHLLDEAYQESKRLLTTGRISSDGIKYGLYNPKNQTL